MTECEENRSCNQVVGVFVHVGQYLAQRLGKVRGQNAAVAGGGSPAKAIEAAQALRKPMAAKTFFGKSRGIEQIDKHFLTHTSSRQAATKYQHAVFKFGGNMIGKFAAAAVGFSELAEIGLNAVEWRGE